MEQVQNGRPYIRYTSSSQAEECKKLRGYIPYYFKAKSTLIHVVQLTFNKIEKTKPKNFNFVLLLSFSFFLVTHNSKLYNAWDSSSNNRSGLQSVSRRYYDTWTMEEPGVPTVLYVKLPSSQVSDISRKLVSTDI